MRLPSYKHMRTMALLHQYFRKSLLIGRMPSLLGREVFPARMQGRSARAFEDTVLFVCDVDRCLTGLEPIDQRLVAFCILEDHTEWDAARQFHRTQSDISRRLHHTLDLLHDTFCRLGLLKPLEAELLDGSGAAEAEQAMVQRRGGTR